MLAAARIAAGQTAAARAGLTSLPRLDRLNSDDRLLLADVLLRLERWADLQAVLADWRAPTPTARQTVNRFRALESIHREQFAVGLAILDELLQSAPDDYELRLWRAICLAKAGQRDAARQALAHESLAVDRPEVWYWRGMVELASGNTQAAEQAYQRAVAADRGYAPAWEALGSLSLNADRVDEAIRLLSVAIDVGRERPSAYFLLAIAHARASDRLATLAALQTALTLDPTLLDTALATEMIATLVDEAELRRIAETRPANAE
jgi:tetratricopeptide (TPR) repeat protein